jgi:hypothetical protein
MIKVNIPRLYQFSQSRFDYAVCLGIVGNNLHYCHFDEAMEHFEKMPHYRFSYFERNSIGFLRHVWVMWQAGQMTKKQLVTAIEGKLKRVLLRPGSVYTQKELETRAYDAGLILVKCWYYD